VLIAIVGVIACTAAAEAIAPRVGVALAGAPIVGPLLRDSGLEAVAERLVGLTATDMDQGVTVRLVAGYADAARTAVGLQLEPPARVEPNAISLTDQFGHSYRIRGMIADASTGEHVLLFEPLEGPAALLGGRLTLSVAALTLGGGDVQRGAWHVTDVLIADRFVSLPPPAPGTVGQVAITFDGVSVAPGALVLDMSAIDPRGSLLAEPKGVVGTTKPRAAVTATLRAEDGRMLEATIVQMRDPSGTTTRAPTAGTGRSSGTR
jgi:hypothetical protein